MFYSNDKIYLKKKLKKLFYNFTFHIQNPKNEECLQKPIK